MVGVINQGDIDELFRQLECTNLIPSIIELRPAEIKRIDNPFDREDVLKKFNIVNDLFVGPLLRLVSEHEKRVNSHRKYYVMDLKNYSIQERMRFLVRLLLKYGYKKEQLVDLLPRNVEDVEVLAQARQNGYLENRILGNAARVVEARKYVGYNPGTKTL